MNGRKIGKIRRATEGGRREVEWRTTGKGGFTEGAFLGGKALILWEKEGSRIWARRKR